jgi:hypothetical protein
LAYIGGLGSCHARITSTIACGEVTSLELRSPGTPADTGEVKPDLAPGAIEAPRRLAVNALLQMRVGVRNGGNRSAGTGWVVRVLLSGDPQIDVSDHQIDQFVVTRELASGGQDVYLRNKKLAGIGPGEYYIGSMVDVTQLVPELTETNNVLTTPELITILPEPPDP